MTVEFQKLDRFDKIFLCLLNFAMGLWGSAEKNAGLKLKSRTLAFNLFVMHVKVSGRFNKHYFYGITNQTMYIQEISKLGDYLQRIAYHESVHTGQMLAYFRALSLERPLIWD
jgi:hypothetical protein